MVALTSSAPGSRNPPRRFNSSAVAFEKHVSEGGSVAPIGGHNKRASDWLPTKDYRFVLSRQDVLSAVGSLYGDLLKPFGRILRKRLVEYLQAKHPTASQIPDINSNALRRFCESCEQLRVEDEDGGDWSVVLLDRHACFVDVYSREDLYPEELWSAAGAYFGSAEAEGLQLPGGRYSCAQALKARQLPFLEHYALGQICHIVQLAISQKRLLGYHNGAVVPYRKSQSMFKETCAYFQQPVADDDQHKSSGLQLATWEMARWGVRELLARSTTARKSGAIPLSNIKRLFRSQFKLELSETLLGHAKLSELLHDARFADICTVFLDGCGYMVKEPHRDGVAPMEYVPADKPPGLELQQPYTIDPVHLLEDYMGIAPPRPVVHCPTLLSTSVSTSMTTSARSSLSGVAMPSPRSPRFVDINTFEPCDAFEDGGALAGLVPVLHAARPSITTARVSPGVLHLADHV